MSHFILRTAAAAMAVFSTTASADWYVDTPIPDPPLDALVLYVDASMPGNSGNGLTPETAKRTWYTVAGSGEVGAIELTEDGRPDRILLKRGETWSVPVPPGGSNYNLKVKAGRSSTEPMLINSYGASNVRPQINNAGIVVNGFPGVFSDASHIWFIGLSFDRTSFVNSPNNACEINLFSGTDILIEDCKMSRYSLGGGIGGHDGGRISNVRIRGCVVVDGYDTGGSNQGMIIGEVDGLLIEGCVSDRNGRLSDPTVNAQPGDFFLNHNWYIVQNCTNVLYQYNLSMRSSANGCQMRPGGVAYRNAFINNSFNLLTNNDDRDSLVQQNVFWGGKDIVDINGNISQGAGFAMDVSFTSGSVHSVTIDDNLFTTSGGSQPWVIGPNSTGSTIHDFHVTNNVAYNWKQFLRPGGPGGVAQYSGTSTVTDNIISNPDGARGPLIESEASFAGSGFTFARNNWFSVYTPWWNVIPQGATSNPVTWQGQSGETDSTYTEPTFSDPTRSPATYDAFLGGAGTIDAFYARVRAMSKLGSGWKAKDIKGYLNYMREGFDMEALA